jgi:hypothetical protein
LWFLICRHPPLVAYNYRTAQSGSVLNRNRRRHSWN